MKVSSRLVTATRHLDVLHIKLYRLHAETICRMLRDTVNVVTQ